MVARAGVSNVRQAGVCGLIGTGDHFTPEDIRTVLVKNEEHSPT